MERNWYFKQTDCDTILIQNIIQQCPFGQYESNRSHLAIPDQKPELIAHLFLQNLKLLTKQNSINDIEQKFYCVKVLTPNKGS